MREWIRSGDDGGGPPPPAKPDWARLDAAAVEVERARRRAGGAGRTILVGVGVWVVALLVVVVRRLVAPPAPARSHGLLDALIPLFTWNLDGVDLVVAALGMIGFLLVAFGVLRLVVAHVFR